MRILLVILFIAGLNFCNNAQTKKSGSQANQTGRPTFYKGLYISNPMARNTKEFNRFLDLSETSGINTLLIDVQGKKLPQDIIPRMKSKGIYGIARVVVFHLGLTTEFPTKQHNDSVIAHIRYACDIGFKEINLDYIRYSDGGWKFKADYQKRYANMQSIIRGLREGAKESCGEDVVYGADIFGRVPFIQNDAIGQRVEEYSEVVDILYPMLYPSHFYGMRERQGDPYNTVKEGLEKTMERSQKGTKAVAWVQAFRYHIGVSGLSFQDYIKVQMQAAWDAKSQGFIVWNARNDYYDTLKAFENFKKDNNL